MWFCLAVLAYALVTAVMVVLASRTSNYKQRHDLLIETKRIRIEYMRYLAERDERNKRGNRLSRHDDDDQIIDAEVIGQMPLDAVQQPMSRAA